MSDAHRSIWDLANPTPKQRLAYFAIGTRQFVLCGGASGGGKSQVIHWAPVLYLVDYAWRKMRVPSVEVGVFCESFPMLEDRQIRRCKDLYPDWLGSFRRTDAGPHFELREEFGGGRILYRNLDEPQKYRSTSYAAIFVEELTLQKPTDFHILRQRLGWTGLDHSPFVGATNPGGPLHGLCKKIWIDHQPPDEMVETYGRDAFIYVPFGYRDNPYLAAARVAALNSMPEPLRSALRDGNWDAFGGMFFSSFSRKDLVVPTFQIPANWYLYGALDPGWSAPCSFGLYGVEPLDHQTRSGTVYKVGNYYESGRNSTQHAREVHAWLTSDLLPWTGGRLPRQTFAGEDAFAHKDRNAILSSEATMADEFLRVVIHLTPAITGRVAGWAQLRGMVDRRVLKFFDGLNEPTLAEMEAALADDLNPEDLKKSKPDPNARFLPEEAQYGEHALDETRYASMSIYRPVAPRPKEKREEYAFEDPDRQANLTPLQRAHGGKSGAFQRGSRRGR